MIRCATCGADNYDNSASCFNCGNSFTYVQNAMNVYPVECPNCHLLVPSNSPFCGNCGIDMRLGPVKRGIGGWLVLPLIGVYLTLVSSILVFFSGLIVLLNSQYVSDRLIPTIYFELFINLALFVLSIIALVLFHSKKIVLPKYMIILYILGFLFGFIDTLWVMSIVYTPDMIFTLVSKFVAPAIWIPYFLISKRVKNTFIR